MGELAAPESGQSNVVLIPCYNEAGRVGAVIAEVKRALPESDIVVINDASDDNSVPEALAAGATVLTHPCNLGAGAAAETGYLYALQHGYATVVHLDSDGQHPPAAAPELLQMVEKGEADLVIGSRYLDSGNTSPTPWARRLGNWVFSGLLQMITHRQYTDPTSGFRCLNRRALSFLGGGVYPCDYPDSDVILMSHFAGLRIREVPVHMPEREAGASMHAGLIGPLYYGLRMGLAIFIVLISRRRWQAWRYEETSSC